MPKLKYIKSEIFPNTYFYQCCNCGLDLKVDWLEMVSGTNCKCGAKIMADDVKDAKNAYILKLETALKNETLAEIIVFNILNKTREYYGKDTRASNDFIKELLNDTNEYIARHLEDYLN